MHLTWRIATRTVACIAIGFLMATFFSNPSSSASNAKSASALRSASHSASTSAAELRDEINRFRCASGGTPKLAAQITCQNRSLGQTYLPDTEPTPAVDPNFPNHIVIGSRAFFPTESANQSLNTRIRFSTSFDNGHRWVQGQVPLEGAQNSSSYPSVAFVRAHSSKTDPRRSLVLMTGKVVHGIDQPPYEGGEIGVARSADGGQTWSMLKIVFNGEKYYDKPWLTVDNSPSSPHYGRVYLTAVGFTFGSNGNPTDYPIYFNYSDDGGLTWATPKAITGSDPSCRESKDNPDTACNKSVFGIPAVAPDGTLYVQFANYNNTSSWEFPDDRDGQLMVVRSDDGGNTFTNPTPVVQLEDGQSDMPLSYYLFGPDRQSIYGHQFDWNDFGTLAVNPTNGELAIVFADRGKPNPYATAGCWLNASPPDLDPCHAGKDSQTNVYLVRSRDKGRTWTKRELVDRGVGSQWFPWAAYKSDGTLVIAWDEDTRPAPADETVHVLWQNGHRQVLNAFNPEHPDFSVANWIGKVLPDKSQWPTVCGPAGHTDTKGAPAEGKDCTFFLGNYSGLAIDSKNRIHVTWTGSNRFVTSAEIDPFTGDPREGYRQTAMYALR